MWYYKKRVMPCLIHKLRLKNNIRVLFVITEIGPWKTKELYKAMLFHPRFTPILGVSESCEVPYEKKNVMKVLEDLGYDYVDLDSNPKQVFKSLSPDIIFYQKPYECVYQSHLRFYNHLHALFCYVFYAFYSSDVSFTIDQPLFSCVWQQYFENKLTASPSRLAQMDDGGKRAIITGLPMQDQLLEPKDGLKDPWKKQSQFKKRIIYAPHHTIANIHIKGFAVSSFLENGEFMLDMMHKYADKVQWAFKPHPLLYKKLVAFWGKEKTDHYYNEWKSAENAQFEDGEYDSLFKYSDAMIHDCGSFTIEYHFTRNPVMYLIRQEGLEAERNAFGEKAFDLHYKGRTHEDIEHFIQNVIKGIDPMRNEREKFYNDYLLPPHGKTACENIINSILGEENISANRSC